MFTPTRSRRAAVVLVAIACALSGRGQVTESPHTVAPGRVLVEMDGIRLSFDRADAAGNTYSAVGIASTLFTAGLTKDLDLQVGLDFYHRETVKFRGFRDSHSGLGDMSFRTKWTFWRNDSLGAAAAVIPYVIVPTSRDGIGSDSVEGGFIVPWTMKLQMGLTAGAMFHWDIISNDADDGYDARWRVSSFIEQPLPAGFALYAEVDFSVVSMGFSNWTGELGAGARWRWSEHLEFDYELLRGLNRRASDWTHVLRVNWGW